MLPLIYNKIVPSFDHKVKQKYTPFGNVRNSWPLRQKVSTQTVALFSLLLYNTHTALGGELAVPCCLQSATVGLNVAGGLLRGKLEIVRSVDIKVLCNVILLTVSGWEHSSTTQLERVPQGSFEVATCENTVSA